jgi:hypothetical protein
VSRLSGIEAASERLRGQLASADASLAERDAALQLLNADKAYLSKELQVGLFVCWFVCCAHQYRKLALVP